METRTYDPEDDGGIGKLVRDALGETHRPFEPGDPDRTKTAEQIDQADEVDEAGADDDENPLTAALPTWEGDSTERYPDDQDAPAQDNPDLGE